MGLKTLLWIGLAVCLVGRAHARAQLRALAGVTQQASPLTLDWLWIWLRSTALLFSADGALASLARSGDTAAIKPILWRLRFRQGFDPFKPKAIAALGQLRSPAALAELDAALKKEDWHTYKETIAALVAYGASGVPALSSAVRGRYGDEAIEALGAIGDPSAAETLSRVFLATPDANYTTRRLASQALARIGQAGVDPLLQGLAMKDRFTRMFAVDALRDATDPRVAPAVRGRLVDGDDYVRRAALEYVWHHSGRAAVNDLIAELNRGHSKEAGEYAATMLGQTSAAQAKTALVEALSARHWTVREKAVAALDTLGITLQGEDLARYEVARGNIASAAALGKVAVIPLIEGLDHPMLDSQVASASWLEQFFDEHAAWFTVAALERLADLPVLKGTVIGRVYAGSCDEEGTIDYRQGESDPAQLRQLARQEQLRRARRKKR